VGVESLTLLDLVFAAVSFPILGGCIISFVRLSISQQKGERLTLKWLDLNPVRKTMAGLVIVWICFNLYLAIGNELALLNIIVLPFGWIYSLAGSAIVWGATASTVGLAILLQLRFPKRQLVA
jgi:hypothetical protein